MTSWIEVGFTLAFYLFFIQCDFISSMIPFTQRQVIVSLNTYLQDGHGDR
jgi:hypothetical protein